MSYVDDRETFFNRDDTEIIRALTERSVHQANAATQITPGDFETTTGYTRHRPKDTAMPHLMTAQYVDELVYKQPGLAVVDKDGDTWGWVIDRHKGETGWVVGDTHDDRMQALRDGARVQPQLPPDCERYEFVQETTETTCATTCPTPDPLEGSIHTPASFTEGMEAHISGPDKPYIIAVEGIDGAGKNTYTQKLATLLNAQVVSFPQYGATSAAELIEGGLRDAEKYSPWHMAQLFAADRKESAHLLTGPGVIIVDRYVASNAAYLHAKTGYHDAYDAMETLEYDTLELPKPDLQIFVDTPVTVAMGRTQSRAESTGGEPDTNETDQGLQERVRESYLKMVEAQWVSPWIVIDGAA